MNAGNLSRRRSAENDTKGDSLLLVWWGSVFGT